MDIHTYRWGCDVYCGNEPYAKLARVVIDPEKAVVTDLVVEQGLLMKKAWVVPRREVEQADGDGIWLGLSQDELMSSRPYKRRVIEEVAEGYSGGATVASPTSIGTPDMGAIPTVSRVVHDGVASDQLRVMEQGVEVRDLIRDKAVGRLKQIVVDARSGEIVQLTVGKGLLGEESSLHSEVVKYYDEDRIVVDEALSEEQPQATPSPPPFEAVSEPEAEPEMQQSRSSNAGDASIPLTTRIEQALHDDPRTRDEVIEVVEQHGIVTLIGEVSKGEANQAAQEIAAEQPGVISVQSNLKVQH